MSAVRPTAGTPPLRVGLIGLGTVGQGVLRVLKRNAEDIARRAGRPIEVTTVAVRDLARRRDCDLSGVRVTDDARTVVRGDVDVVVELIGGLSPAEGLIVDALARGVPVVTANKALLAERGTALFQRARASGAALAFEAAVAGGIPIIKVLREGLAANRFSSVIGILNGTSNYILTQMREAGDTFADALAAAQRLGYAEADPTFDVDGIDAAHKLTLLASIAFGAPVPFSAVVTEGIGDIQPQDIALAGELGYRIKSLAIAKRMDRGIELRVQPTLLPTDSVIAKVDGVLNAILVDGDAVGQTVYVGRGAGAEATASAVIADLIDIARLHGAPSRHWVAPLGAAPGANPGASQPTLNMLPVAATASAHYLRLRVADERGVLRAITSILAEADISIEAILQKEPRHGEDATVAIITSVVGEAKFHSALQKLGELPFLRPGLIRLRVEHF
jgi:homoserine dehydrogenase